MFQVNIPLKSAIENLKFGESFPLCKKRFLFNQYSEFIGQYIIQSGQDRFIPFK